MCRKGWNWENSKRNAWSTSFGPSCSPFASQVLLVKKKDGSWWLCVDYRELNNITTENKFRIPFLDELYGSCADYALIIKSLTHNHPKIIIIYIYTTHWRTLLHEFTYFQTRSMVRSSNKNLWTWRTKKSTSNLWMSLCPLG